MALGSTVPAPVGFLRFCGSHPGACGPSAATSLAALGPRAVGAGAERVDFTPRLSLRALDRSLREDDSTAQVVQAGSPPAVGMLHSLKFDVLGAGETPASDPAPAPTDDAAPPARIVLDKANAKLLKVVNRRVNRTVSPRSDMQTLGRAEFWSLPIAVGDRLYGDCEDYALQKKADLVAAGLPAAAMTIAVAHTRQGQVHAVLVVATDRGDMVLDNRSSWVLPWTAVKYRWIMRQVSGDSMQWARISADARA